MTSGVLCVLTDDDRRSSEELLSGKKKMFMSVIFVLFFFSFIALSLSGPRQSDCLCVPLLM